LPAVLPRHADRQRALLRQRRVVDHQRRVRTAQQLVGLFGQHAPERAVVPGRAGDEVLQLVVPGQAEAGRHRLQALALARAEQPAQVERRPGPARLPAERGEEGRQPSIQVVGAVAGVSHAASHPAGPDDQPHAERRRTSKVPR
jgi:hypothetical protein